MKRKFKAKRYIKIKYIPYLIIISIILISIITLTYISNLKLIKNNVITLLENSNIYNPKIKEQQKKLITIITGIDINKPTTILENTSNYERNDNMNLAFALEKNEKQQQISTNPQVSTEPLVYIYNTHQTEEYAQNNNEAYTITPTVLVGAYYLQEQLEKLGIKTIVEEASIPEILKENNWNYTQSYKASRINLEKIKNEYPSIKLFIDFHRDAVPKTSSTVTIDGKEYAKILFLIGKEHNNYLENLEFTTRLNDIVKEKYPTLTKGILQKAGVGVNGIYNQDIGKNVILMEVGGNENTIEEVANTIDLIAPLIKEKIDEE